MGFWHLFSLFPELSGFFSLLEHEQLSNVPRTLWYHVQIVSFWSSHCGAVETNPTRNHEVAVQSLASLSGLGILHCHELWCRSQTWFGSALLRLWCRPAAVAPIPPLAGEPPYTMCAALKKKRKKKSKNKQTKKHTQKDKKIIINKLCPWICSSEKWLLRGISLELQVRNGSFFLTLLLVHTVAGVYATTSLPLYPRLLDVVSRCILQESICPSLFLPPLLFFFFFFFCFFRAMLMAYGGSQARGLNQSCSCWPMPQPQQH